MSEYFRKPIVKTLMLKGQEGQSIKGITKTGTSGLVDTYTITLTDGTTSTFTVTNGKEISSIDKTGTSGLVDTYTITFNDGTNSTFTVTNGKGISNISKTGTDGLVDTYTIEFNDGTTSTFTVTNGDSAYKPAVDALGKRIDNLILSSGTESSAEVVDARNGYDGTTYDTLGTAIRSQVSALKGDLDRVLNKYVIIPANSGDLIKFYIPKNTDFTFKTVDGNNFKITSTIRVLRKDKTEIDYWSFFNTENTRTVNSGSEDIYYIRVNPVHTVDQEINVSYKDEKSIESRVENIEDKIPSFYENYLDNRISTIQENDLLIGNNGDSFIFITDLHNENNYYSPKLAHEICKKTSVDRIIYGGDYINEPSSKNDAINYLTTRRNKCLVSTDVIFLRGNHDTNPYGTGQLTISEFYSIFDKHIEKNINTNKNTYFYENNISQKIRYFYLDSGVDGVIETEQKNWLKAKAEELDQTWTIVVFVHHGIYTDAKDDRTSIKNYPSLTIIKESLAGSTAKVACVICGHAHIDIEDTSGKYPIICTTCDAHGVQSNSASSDDRTVGTITEQAFDVFHIDTFNKKIYVTRIGGGKNNIRNGSDYTLNDREFSYI